MTLIKSISGFRGTIGGKPGNNPTPLDLVKFTSAFVKVLEVSSMSTRKIVLGRDARVSGEMIRQIVAGTLMGLGFDVIDLGLASTPTTELAVVSERADGGIILTASHNPGNWNAMKLLNNKGEFINAEVGKKLLEIAESGEFSFAPVESLGKYELVENADEKHIAELLKLGLVNPLLIKNRKFRIGLDCVNSVGGLILPKLLKNLGVEEIIELYCDPSGIFPHNPEPLAEHLTEICNVVKDKKLDMAFVVDPDVDRLAIIDENGVMFGEEYTLVAVADYILKNTPGPTVSNLSSSRALKDVSIENGCEYFTAAVGEVNVVEKMKETDAVIGGEGNGGIIYPELHFGRDALVGIALFLSYLASEGSSVSELRKKYPAYFMSKKKIELSPEIKMDSILMSVAEKFKKHQISTIDGVKIDFPENWVHLRKSNTEPIIRVYAEAKSQIEAEKLADSIINLINSISKGK